MTVTVSSVPAKMSVAAVIPLQLERLLRTLMVMVPVVEVSSPNRQETTCCCLPLLPGEASQATVADTERSPVATYTKIWPEDLLLRVVRLAKAEGAPLRFKGRHDVLEHAALVIVLAPDAARVEGLRLAGVLDHIEEQRRVVKVLPSTARLVRPAPAKAWTRAEVGLVAAVPHRRWKPLPLVAPTVEEQEVVLGLSLRLQEHLRHVLAVIDAVGIHVHAGKLAQRGEHVHAADDLARSTVRLDLPLPIGEGGGADAALPSGALPGVPVARRAPREYPGASGRRSVLQLWAVVAGEEDHRVLQDAGGLQRLVDVADHPVRLCQSVDEGAAVLPPESATGILRSVLPISIDGVHVAEGDVEEERLVPVPLYEANGKVAVLLAQGREIERLLEHVRLPTPALLDEGQPQGRRVSLRGLHVLHPDVARVVVGLPVPGGLVRVIAGVALLVSARGLRLRVAAHRLKRVAHVVAVWNAKVLIEPLAPGQILRSLAQVPLADSCSCVVCLLQLLGNG
eukprot:CAMPEP_0171183352 /NCGR_PEP_ID=MMETSP0790-20130122/15235_1 /TAXON_ID=2925 /ORGANISM="Alexandrium catenella, Strain OF101" /LENGTH=509 /DNA_ID=CAMNT_0011648327 /DNA_START=26 /DNA_END=1552 /DNA_ORIENTATION=-